LVCEKEYQTFPNTMILGPSIINYHTSSDEDEERLILNSTITFGYGTPSRPAAGPGGGR
jgi:hypothetical protein